ncbi:MAG: hydroxymethylbilane synthase [Candidatus Eisenbacteria bacterium]
MRSRQSTRFGVGAGSLGRLHAESIRKEIREFVPDMRVRIVELPAKKGHAAAQASTSDVIVPGQFETALLSKRIDVAILSMADVPQGLTKELQIGAVTERLTPFDALLSRKNLILDELPAGARVATGSLRVKAQLLNYRPDLEIVWTGLDMDAQMKRMASGVFEAVVIAAADAEYLGLQEKVAEVFTTSICLPAAGQGSLCLLVRRGEKEILKAVKHVDDHVSRAEINAELHFLAALGGFPLLPAGALGRTNGKELVVEGFVASPDGKQLLKETETGCLGEEKEIGVRLAQKILQEGGGAILSSLAAT